MAKTLHHISRRRLVAGGLTLAGWTALTGAGAVLVPTPRQSAGPFYPDKLPLDSDADLVSVAGRGAPALGVLESRPRPCNRHNARKRGCPACYVLPR